MPIVSRNPAPAGGGSGVQVVTVPVSSAQILDLFNTPVVLIPGVAGNVTVVNGYSLRYIAGLVPYLDGGGSIAISAPNRVLRFDLVTAAGFWDQATSQVITLGYTGLGFDGDPADFDGQDIVLAEDTANPTLGDGTLLVTLSYFLAPVV